MSPRRSHVAIALVVAAAIAACTKGQPPEPGTVTPETPPAATSAPSPAPSSSPGRSEGSWGNGKAPEPIVIPIPHEPIDLSLKPCTGKSDAPSCVKCDGNDKGLCTPTEAIFVNYDIKKGYLAGKQETRGSCYECLWNAGCVDDTVNVDKNHECEDLTGNVDAGASVNKPMTQACYDTLRCILDSGCQNAKVQAGPSDRNGIANCLCGSKNQTTLACLAATPETLNGACYAAELNGLGATSTTSMKTVLSEFTLRKSGSGMANSIFLCAGSNSGNVRCPACFESGM
jgi:hypothetical protein